MERPLYVNNILFCALAGVLWYSQFFGLSLGKGFLVASPVLLTFSWYPDVAERDILECVGNYFEGMVRDVLPRPSGYWYWGLIVLIVSSFLPQLLK